MLWYPYTQMKHVNRVPKMVAGNGVMMELEDGRKLIDGISSWWSVIHGYNHPALNSALAEQAGKFAHVMLGGLTHQPALHLAEALVRITPAGLNHVFFSDSGSIGVEVALKTAIQYWKNLGYEGKTRMVSLKNGYHGDTFKAMEVSDDSDFSRAFADVLHRGYVLEIPGGGFDATAEMVEPAIDALEQLLTSNSPGIAAFIVEPIVQCAGGFHIYSSLYLKAARELCDRYNVLLIFDEVATGFGRTGKLFAAEHAGVTPDIMVVGKALTAGYMGHAATLSTDAVYNSFLGADYEKALMHGPTFMANALACTVALKSIELFEQEDYLSKIKQVNAIIEQEFSTINSPLIADKRSIGAIGVLEFNDAAMLDGFKAFAMDEGVWLRPIGKMLYLMPPYIIKPDELIRIINVMRKWIIRST
ncbi:adenosylmethionine--8-amino-7-oxononanoate transaminase [Mucilaginibacter sp. UR6-1]|uniref:adenosylmethionine--8-amino-7-oxononanoate transaminase n=1 Tax=Mucilaginibacter sp. UR6-1 TaxID=1435643 RepID=UPI002103C24B|nr:adenosylmethionine--8-amino-7-oxononanoate transaminase [Mucilaginibacter sp. UR6-1]MCC8410655.1 adenosylmethionine--8-amino-7-oxononanoate transaminase [Mucilaginibacter sp. UR6-1]